MTIGVLYDYWGSRLARIRDRSAAGSYAMSEGGCSLLRMVESGSGRSGARLGRRITLFALPVVFVLSMVINAGPARAAGDTSCGKPWTNQVGTVYTCDLWPSSSIPVLAQPDGSSKQVGVLKQGGWANWFTSQTKGATYTAHDYQNDWWARTMADDGQWGYVSEVYFARGANFERDASLPVTDQASPPSPPQGPPGSLGTPGAGAPPKPKPRTATRCGPREPVVLRIIYATPDYWSGGDPSKTGAGQGDPSKGGSKSANVTHQLRPHVEAPPSEGGGSSDTETIGTLQNCVHRTGNKAYGRTALHLKKGWNIYNSPLIIKTYLHVHDGHSPGAGSLSVEDRPGTEVPGRNRHGDAHAWYLTRALAATATGHADDNTNWKPDRPANGTFVWDTKPTRFSASATYEVDTKVRISSIRAFLNSKGKKWRLKYAGWAPAQGQSRSEAMLDLTRSWYSGPLSF